MADDLDRALDDTAALAHACSAAWAAAVLARATNGAESVTAAANAALAATLALAESADAVRTTVAESLDTDSSGSAIVRGTKPRANPRR